MDNSVKIQMIRNKYKCSLSNKSEKIGQLVALILGESLPSEELMNDVYGYLHNLAGSSGMYGYDDIAKLSSAAMLEAKNNQRQILVTQLQQLQSLLHKHANS